MPDSTVSAGYTRGLLHLAVSKGASAALLLERSSIDPQELQDPDNRIALPRYVALMKAGKELCADLALALHYGEAVDLGEVSIAALICGAASTVGEAWLQMNRYGRLLFDEDSGRITDHLELVRDNEGLWLEVSGAAFVAHPCLTESAFARCVCGARALFGSTPYFASRPFPRAVHVTHEEPSYRAEYARILGVRPVFGARRNAILIDEGFLTLEMPPSNRYVFGILSKHAEALLRELESSKSTRGRVETLLMPILHTGDADIEVIAGKLGFSRQTLFRRLKAEGVTFSGVLDELRHRLALRYLSGNRVSVNETAYLVGFSEPAAFSRAFKRWTGASPRALHAARIARDQDAS